MSPTSYAKALLEHWGVVVEDIPTSDNEKKQEADFLACFDGVSLLIEEKTKEDDPVYLAKRSQELANCQVHAVTLPLCRDETLSGLVRDASRQLRSSSDKPHAFRLMWFTATGLHAEGKYEQFMATLYGGTNILELNAPGYRRCYYFRHADFFRRADIIDGGRRAYGWQINFSKALSKFTFTKIPCYQAVTCCRAIRNCRRRPANPRS